MKIIKKTIFIFLIVTTIIPIHSMFSRTKRLPKNTKTSTSAIPRRPFKYTGAIQSVGKQIASAQRPTKSSIAQWLAARKNQFLRWYTNATQSKLPALGQEQKVLSVPLQMESEVVLMPVPVAAPIKSQAHIEAEDIVNKLRSKNPWGYPKGILSDPQLAIESPFAKQIENFLLKSNVPDIENVLSELIEHLESSVLLETICANHNNLIPKLLPFVEKSLDKIHSVTLLGTILLSSSSEQLLKLEKLIERFFNMTNGFLLLNYYTTEEIAKLLPKNTAKLIPTIRVICDKLTFYQMKNQKHIHYNELVWLLTDTFVQKSSQIGNNELKVVMEEIYRNNLHDTLFEQIVLNSNPMLKNKLIDYIKNDIKSVLESNHGIAIVYKFVLDNSITKDFLGNYISSEPSVIKRFFQDYFGYELITLLSFHNPIVKELLITYLKTESNSSIIKSGIEWLSTNIEPSYFIELLLEIDKSYAKIPSYRHLKENVSSLKNLGFANINNENAGHMVKDIFNKEKESMDDYEVFYHGRRWQYSFLSDLYGSLYENQSGKPLKDFIFTHLVEQGVKGSEKFSKAETEKRERLLQKGNQFPFTTKLPLVEKPSIGTKLPFMTKVSGFTKLPHKTATVEQLHGFGDRQSLLFLNKFLFGNLNRLGSCSMNYILTNHNMGEIEFSLKEIFNMFGNSDIYEIYEQELKELQKEHSELSQYGEMLQILIPKNNVDKSVYYTTSGGPKKEFVLHNGGKTTDIKTILDDLDQYPQDEVEFVLVNTRDKFGGLNPESGIKIFSYNLVDPEKMAAFKAKEKALFDRIKESLKEKKQRMQKEKAEMMGRE